MSLFKIIKEWIGNIKHGKKLYFIVESIAPEIIEKYHDLHWYIEESYGKGKFPATILFIGVEGKSQDKIFVYYDDRMTNQSEIEKMLFDFGIYVKK